MNKYKEIVDFRDPLGNPIKNQEVVDFFKRSECKECNKEILLIYNLEDTLRIARLRWDIIAIEGSDLKKSELRGLVSIVFKQLRRDVKNNLIIWDKEKWTG